MDDSVKKIIYDQEATARSKRAITFWVIVGLIMFFFADSISVFSWRGLLYFVPGMFLASFLAAPFFVLKSKVSFMIIEDEKNNLRMLVHLLNLLEFAFDILFPIIFFKLIS